MTSTEVIQIGRDLMMTTIIIALPAVLTSLLVGLFVSILQTVTSIQEQTLTFAPRIAAVAVVLLLSLPWTIRVVTAFTTRMLTHAANVNL